MDSRIAELAEVVSRINNDAFERCGDDWPNVVSVGFTEDVSWIEIADATAYHSEADHVSDYETCRNRIVAYALQLLVATSNDITEREMYKGNLDHVLAKIEASEEKAQEC